MIQSKISAVIILVGENLQAKTVPYDLDLAILPILPMLSSPVLHKTAPLAQQSFFCLAQQIFPASKGSSYLTKLTRI